MSVSTARSKDKLNTSITLRTNDKDHASVRLVGEATVKSAMRIQPDRAAFGRVKRNSDATTKTLTLTRGDGGPINPSVHSTGRSNVSAAVREIEPNEKYELDITVAPPWPNSRINGQVLLDTGVEESPRQRVTYYGAVDPRLQAQPARIQIPADYELGSELTATLNWSTDRPPGHVTDVRITIPNATARVEERNENQVLVVELPQGYEPARRRLYHVMVQTDDPQVKQLRVPIYFAPRRIDGPAAQGAEKPAMKSRRTAPSRARGVERGG